jgi:hypothetical protein
MVVGGSDSCAAAIGRPDRDAQIVAIAQQLDSDARSIAMPPPGDFVA